MLESPWLITLALLKEGVKKSYFLTNKNVGKKEGAAS